MNCNGKMSFGDFVFPVNPGMIKISHKRTAAVQKVPNENDIVCDMGIGGRVITGEGEFFGDDCEEQFGKLKKIFEKGGAGILYIPSQEPIFAIFKELEFRADDIEGVIKYSFVFVESYENRTVKKFRRCISDGIKTMWDYSYGSGTDIETLMELNPDVTRPDVPVSAGKEVALC